MSLFNRFLFALIFLLVIDVGSSETLIHRDSTASPNYDATLTPFQRVKTIVQRSLTFHKSIATSSSSASGAPVQANPSLLDYVMLIYIGKGSVPVWVTIDTYGFFSWLLCSPCYPLYPTCSYNLSYNYQLSAEYNCSATLQCPNIYQASCYNDYCISGFNDYGGYPDYLSSDVVSVSSSLSYPLVYFGCLFPETVSPYPLGNAYGSFSLGIYPLSFVNQIGVESFAYCLQYLSSAENSTIYFGNDAKIVLPLVSTPFYSLDQSGYYWVTLLSFTVGFQIIDFPEANLQSGGNMIVEPSTFLTSLPTSMVTDIVSAIEGVMHFPRAYDLELELGLSLCYNVTDYAEWYIAMPLIVATFVDGILPLQYENIFFEVESGIQCLTIVSYYYLFNVPEIQFFGSPLLGSGIQANFNVEYDLADNLIKFQPNVNCVSPPV